MSRDSAAVNRIKTRVEAAARSSPRLLLAVSGGRDSMVLLDAVERTALGRKRVIVATFDHGTGSAARSAVQLVAAEAGARGFPCIIGRSGRPLRGEAEWRSARWGFLREVAGSESARIITAHSRDDQVETVVIRILRDAGARGLAGLYAPSDVLRPLLDVSRAEIARYADRLEIAYLIDPSNLSRAYLRNRIRLDLLPAIERVRPAFAGQMLAIARRAAEWREAVEGIVDLLGMERLDASTVRIATESLEGYDAAALRILWPAIAARAGVTMDRRGTERAAAFTLAVLATGRDRTRSTRRESSPLRTRQKKRGRVIQLSGGWEIMYIGSGFIVRGR